MTQETKKLTAGIALAFVAGIFVGGLGVSAFQAMRGKEAQKEEKEVDEKYDAQQCVKLGKYKGITVSLAATDEDIQIEVDSLLEEHTQYEQKSGTAVDGDMVYADFDGYVGGKKKEDTCGSDYIEIGSGSWLEGFEEAFIGMKTGQKKEFTVDVPEGTYGDSEIDGHEVLFKVKLQYICGDEIVPEYNDEFVQSISEYKSVKEYNAYLKKRLEKENEEDKLEYAWSEVMDASKVTEYPESLIKAAEEEVLQGYYGMAEIYGVSHDEIFQSFGCEDEQDFRDTQLDELAEDTVKEWLVAEAISQKENVNYTEEDYASLLQEEYEGNSDSYKNKEEYEEANQFYLEHMALIQAVKEWIGKNTTYTK